MAMLYLIDAYGAIKSCSGIVPLAKPRPSRYNKQTIP